MEFLLQSLGLDPLRERASHRTELDFAAAMLGISVDNLKPTPRSAQDERPPLTAPVPESFHRPYVSQELNDLLDLESSIFESENDGPNLLETVEADLSDTCPDHRPSRPKPPAGRPMSDDEIPFADAPTDQADGDILGEDFLAELVSTRETDWRDVSPSVEPNQVPDLLADDSPASNPPSASSLSITMSDLGENEWLVAEESKVVDSLGVRPAVLGDDDEDDLDGSFLDNPVPKPAPRRQRRPPAYLSVTVATSDITSHILGTTSASTAGTPAPEQPQTQSRPQSQSAPSQSAVRALPDMPVPPASSTPAHGSSAQGPSAAQPNVLQIALFVGLAVVMFVGVLLVLPWLL